MRRASILCVLFLAGCAHKPVWVDQHPATGERGRPGVSTEPVLLPATNTNVCPEVRRVQCDAEGCGGPNLDRVTIRCPGEPAFTRCEANTKCGAH
jgi:hypothetical protein